MSCCEGVYGWFYNLTHTPLTRKKLLIGGGVIIIIIIIIILAATLSGGGGGGGGSHPKEPGHNVIMRSPLVVGSNNLAESIKVEYMNKIENVDLENMTNFQTDLKRLGNGFVATQVWSVGSSDCASSQGKDAVVQTLEQIDLMKRVIAKYAKMLVLYTNSQGIEDAKKNKMVSCILSVSGGHNFDGRASVLRMFHDLGVRAMSLVGNCSTHWGGSADVKNGSGLNDFGKSLIAEMNRLGIVIDLTTSSQATRRDALNVTSAPVIFSMSNAANITDHAYNVDNATLDLVKNNTGLVMVSFVASQVKSENATIDDVIAHMQFLKKKVGVDHIGIGGGFDLGGGELVAGLEDVSKFGDFFDILANKNWTQEELTKIAGGNFERVMKDVEKVAKELQSKTNQSEEYEPYKDFPSDEKFVCYSDVETRGYTPNATATTVTSPTVPTSPTTTPTSPTTSPTSPTTTSTTSSPKKSK